MEFYTVVVRQSAGYWVSLCLENGIVGQGNNQQESVDKLKETIESFQLVYAKIMWKINGFKLL